MTWCNDSSNDVVVEKISSSSSSPSRNDIHCNGAQGTKLDGTNSTITCPSCGYKISFEQQGRRINDLPGLPAGVRFDPTDQEILLHLEGKVKPESCNRLHPLIDEFIPTLEGENGICYTHPQKLPGVSKNGQLRHFFHRPSKAYTTGTRKRRKVHTEEEGSETRWHKTGKTRPIIGGGKVKGYKKILVLYTNYGKEKKPEKTSWVMHQYHLGINEEEKEGELVVSKVFYQTQPRQCGAAATATATVDLNLRRLKATGSHPYHHVHHQNDVVPFQGSSSSIISFDQRSTNSGGRVTPSTAIIPFCCP